MIEVLRDNTKEKFYTLCESCLSELSYEYEDVVTKDIEFSYIPDRHITCPICNKETSAGLKTRAFYSFDGSHFKLMSPMFANCCEPAPAPIKLLKSMAPD